MPNYVAFPSLPVYDPVTGDPIAELRGETGVVVARGTDTPLDLFDMNGLPLAQPLIVNDTLRLPTFQVDGLTQADFVSGTYRMPIFSPAGLEESARQSAADAAAARQSANLSEVSVTAQVDEAKVARDEAVQAAEDAQEIALLDADTAVSYLLRNKESITGETFRDSQTSINARFEFDGIVPVTRGTTPSGWVDSTDAIQAAILEAEATGAELVLPAPGPGQGYLVNGGLTISKPIRLVGTASHELKPSGGTPRPQMAGTLLLATEALDGRPVLNVSPSGTHMYGFDIRGISLNGWAGGPQVDRVGFAAERIHAEFYMERVSVSGFKRQGIRFREIYDGTMIAPLVFTCGTAGTYAGFDIGGANGNNSNAIHIHGLHIESCPFLLSVTGSSRHIQFDASKFELYSEAPTTSPIQFINCQEIVMNSPQFVYRNTNDRYFYPSDSTQPAMVQVSGTKARLTVNSPMANTPPYFTEPARPHDGARWFKAENGARLRIPSGGDLNVVWGGGGQPGICMGDRGILTSNTIVSRVANGQRSFLQLGAECIVDANQFEAATEADAAVDVTSGALITATGERNTIGSSNKFRVSAGVATGGAFFSGPGEQYVHEMERRIVTLPAGQSILNVGWVDRGNTRMFRLANTVATDVTAFTGARKDDEVTIQFTTALTRLVHSATFKLRGGGNITVPAEKVMSFRYDGAIWYETNRNF